MIFHAIVRGRTDLHDVLRQLRHHEGVAPKVGQIHQLLVIQHLALGGVRRLDQRSRFRHQHALGDLADFQLHVHRDLLLRADNDAFAFELLEAGRLAEHGICRGNNFVKVVFAAVIRRGCALSRGAFVDQRDLGSRHHAAVLIDYDASYYSIVRLGEECRASQTHQ